MYRITDILRKIVSKKGSGSLDTSRNSQGELQYRYEDLKLTSKPNKGLIIKEFLNRFRRKKFLPEKTNEDYSQYDFNTLTSKIEDTGELENYYRELKKIVQDKDKYYPLNINGIEHTARVTFFAMILATLDNFSEQDKNLLLLAARYHDIGRTYEYDTDNYGVLSVEKIKDLNLLKEFAPEDRHVVEFAIKQNLLSGKENEKSLKEIPFWKREKYRVILNYLKDAETLERVGKIDENIQLASGELMTQTAKRLVSFAHKVHGVFF